MQPWISWHSLPRRSGTDAITAKAHRLVHTSSRVRHYPTMFSRVKISQRMWMLETLHPRSNSSLPLRVHPLSRSALPLEPVRWTPQEAAQTYDEDVEKQAQQLGLPGW